MELDEVNLCCHTFFTVYKKIQLTLSNVAYYLIYATYSFGEDSSCAGPKTISDKLISKRFVRLTELKLRLADLGGGASHIS